MNTFKKITFGTYEGWGFDEMFGGDVFKGIKVIESNGWEQEQEETYEILLEMVEQARKEFFQVYYKKRRSFYGRQRAVRMKTTSVFSEDMEQTKKYINTRFKKQAVA